MPMLVATVTADKTDNHWWSNFVISDIKNNDGTPAVVNKLLYLNFKSPGEVNKDNVQPYPWADEVLEISNNLIDHALYDVTVKAHPKATYKPAKFTIGVLGDLHSSEAKTKYLDTFVLYADEEPNLDGTVEVDVAACPDPALEHSPVTVRFSQGQIVHEKSLKFGFKQAVRLKAGSYTASAKPVATEGDTVDAPVGVSPADLKVDVGHTVPLSVIFAPVVKHGALDVTVSNDLAADLGPETVTVQVVDKASGYEVTGFAAKVGSTTQRRGLPYDSKVEVRVKPITVNNVTYTFGPQERTLGTALAKVTLDLASATRAPLETTGFISQPIQVTTDTPLERRLPIRLIGTDVNYFGDLPVKSGSVQFPHGLKPGHYTAQVSNFLHDGVVHTVKPGVATFDASATAPLSIDIKSGANLIVPGFPHFLSFGACANLTSTNVDDFSAARASVIFKYAGDDGMGDAGVFLEQDTSTKTTLKTARDIEAKVGGGHRVLPMMISYTCNLSQGDAETKLVDSDQHKFSYANYILTLSLLSKAADADHPVSGGIVVNPDFLGACQQNKLPTTGPLSNGKNVPVRAPLKEAIAHAVEKGWLLTSLDIPGDITEDIKGYVQSVNWLTRAVAGKKVSLGWLSNLWGVGSSHWIYDADTSVTEPAISTAKYTLAAGVFDGKYGADFHAIDRYEGDDLTVRAYGPGYCFGRHEWRRYYDFCEALGQQLNKPVMLWQIPASRWPSTNDPVRNDPGSDPFDKDNWGTGGSYLFGHPEIGSDVNNIKAKVRDFKLPATFPPPYTSKPVSALFAREAWDWSRPTYGDFPLRGFFSVLLGGGATTGIVRDVGKTGPWTGAKVAAYMNHPISLKGS